MVVRVSGGDPDHFCVLKIAACPDRPDCVLSVGETLCGYLLVWVHLAGPEQVFRFAFAVMLLLVRQVLQRVGSPHSRPAVEPVVQVRLHLRDLPSQLERIVLFDAPIAFLLVAHPGAFVFVRFLPLFDSVQRKPLLRSFPFPCAVWMAAMKLPCALPALRAFRPFSQASWLFAQAFWLIVFWLFFSLPAFSQAFWTIVFL